MGCRLKDTGMMIGDCGLTMQNINGFIRPEIGYHIKKEYWRQGYGSEAAAGCLRWAFEHTPFKIIYSYMKKANTASSATARRIGMRLADEYTDGENELTEVYSISREAYGAL